MFLITTSKCNYLSYIPTKIIEEKKTITEDQSTDGSKKSNIFLDRILKLEAADLLDHNEVVNEVNTILMAVSKTNIAIKNNDMNLIKILLLLFKKGI